MPFLCLEVLIEKEGWKYNGALWGRWMDGRFGRNLYKEIAIIQQSSQPVSSRTLGS